MKALRKLPLFWKTWAISTAILLALVLLVAALIGVLMTNSYQEKISQGINQTTDRIVKILTNHGVDTERLDRERTPDVAIRIYKDNQLVYPVNSDQPDVDAMTPVQNGVYQINGAVYRLDMFETRTAPLSEAAIMIRPLLGPLLLASIGVAAMVSWLYSWYFTRRITHLYDDISRMKDFSYTVSPQTAKVGDELDQLKTQIEQMYQRLKTSLAQLDKENQYIRQLENERAVFTHGATHELKTPLTTMNLLLEGLAHNIDGYNSIDDFVQKSTRELAKIDDIVNEMLDLARLQNETATTKTPMLAMIDNILDDYALLIADKHLRLRWQKRSDTTVAVPPASLQKIISNLVSNAVKYSPARSTITLSLDTDSFTIRNKIAPGVTIDEATIFQPFVSFDQPDVGGGSGLGLYFLATLLAKYHLPFTCHIDHTKHTFEVSIALKQPYITKQKSRPFAS